MLSASLYILACTSRNRMRQRLRRLREPRYLLGAIAGIAYLYFSFFARLRASRANRRGRAPVNPAAALLALVPSGVSLAGLALFAAAATSWIFPVKSSLVEFSNAEVQFLFPAPVTRRQLFIHRLMRSQLAVLFGSLIMAIVVPSGSISERLRTLVSIWLLLMTSHVFFTGVTLARTRLLAPGPSRLVARAPLIVTIAAIGAFGAAIGRELAAHPVDNLRDAFVALGVVAASGVPRIVLLPFTAMMRPFFTDSWGAFVPAVLLAIVVFAATTVWVVRSDEVFDAESEDVPDRHAPEVAKRKASYRARPIGWTLGLRGRPEAAFVWKGAMQTFRVVDSRIMLRMIAILVWLIVVVTVAPGARGFAQMLGVFAVFGCGFTILMAPQIMRVDMRQDLQNLDLLKTWPVRASAVVRGEIAWPAMVVTAIAWALAVVALFFSAAVFERTGFAWRTAVGGATMILTPALVFAQYTIHNATALLFPAWVPVGTGRPRGVDAMGQRLILLGGTWLMLVVSLLPGAIVGGLLWLAFYRVIGPWILIPAALVTLLIVAIEVLVATEALGPAYERLDITSVERAE